MTDHHDHSHSHSHSHSPPPEDTSDAQSLYNRIYHDQIWTMNESEPDAGRDVVKPWAERYDTTKILTSDADEQVILHIPFTGLVKLYSILIRSYSDDTAPRTIKLFKNRPDLDFSVASDLQPSETLTHVENVGDIVEYQLKRAVFSNVESLTFFVEDNYDADVTTILYIGLRGEWKHLSREPVITIYEAAANPRDHKSVVQSEKYISEFND
ncbi:galactose-binding domain-like protein [Limtongia smithiae]|uniref:galactose-binding domain-like protein n=1 Tax=Limtongia smithiae TaxID=1125753 RepID=UPI0034CF4350